MDGNLDLTATGKQMTAQPRLLRPTWVCLVIAIIASSLACYPRDPMLPDRHQLQCLYGRCFGLIQANPMKLKSAQEHSWNANQTRSTKFGEDGDCSRN